MGTFLSFVCLLLLSSMALAQVGESVLKTKALSFSFNGLNLSGGIGGKIWSSDATAYTVSLSGATSTHNIEGNTQRTEDKNSESFVMLQIGIQHHSGGMSDFSPYLSYGILGSYRKFSVTSSRTPPDTPLESNWNTNSVGAMVGFGVEYWITNRISLAGQQLFQGSYQFGSRSDGFQISESRNISGFDAGLGASSLILSIYF